MAMDLNTKVFEVLVNPDTSPPADGVGVADVEIWKLSLKWYFNWMVQCEKTTQQTYMVVLQCLQTVHNSIKAATSLQAITLASAIMGLLQLI